MHVCACLNAYRLSITGLTCLWCWGEVLGGGGYTMTLGVTTGCF